MRTSSRATDNLLLAMGRMLVSRDKDWWCPSGDPPAWPTTVLMECAEKEPNQVTRSSAAILLAALHDCFPKQFSDHLAPGRLESILKQAVTAVAARSVPGDYISLAGRIRSDWGTPVSAEVGPGTSAHVSPVPLQNSSHEV
jgi:hypothetical protein